MSRPTTSLTLAIWSAVLGCCVWGVNVSQAAVVLGNQECINARESRDTSRHSDFNRAIASLVYWSDLLQAQTSDWGKLPVHPATDTLVWDDELRHTGCRSVYPTPATFSESNNTFTATRNRWSLGFH